MCFAGTATRISLNNLGYEIETPRSSAPQRTVLACPPRAKASQHAFIGDLQFLAALAQLPGEETTLERKDEE